MGMENPAVRVFGRRGFCVCGVYKAPLCKGRWLPEGQTEGLYVTSLAKYNPSAPPGQPAARNLSRRAAH